MVDAQHRDAVELAYQRALTALHEARADLAEVAAARRRLAFDRSRLAPEAAAATEAALEARRADLADRVGRLRDEAEARRADLRRHAGASGVEPDEIEDEPVVEGFQQPPYPGPVS